MLTNIYIKNFLLIEKMDIDFKEGFNVITGETGAGKSVLVKAIQTCIGHPFYESYKLNRDTDSLVSVTIKETAKGSRISELLADYGIEGDTIIIRRSLTSSNKRKSFINDIPASSNLLKKIAPFIFEIYRQNENQLLLNNDYQLSILDSLSPETERLVNQYKELFRHYHQLKKKIETIKQDKHSRERSINNLEYEINEIKQSRINNGEYESLKEKRKIQKNMIIITRLKDNILKNLYEADDSIYTRLSSAVSDIENLSSYITALKEYPKKLNEFYYMIQDIVKTIEDSLMADDPESSLDLLEERMNTLENLFKKYGDSETEVLEYMESAERRLSELKNTDTNLEKLENELLSLEKLINDKAADISHEREKTAGIIIEGVKGTLKEMCLDNAVFDILFSHADNISLYTLNGRDSIEFVYSPHFNIQPLPLNQITSGGELSRISLAVRNVFRTCENKPISIFDEIDNGIGGETANRIGVLLKEMASDSQVIAITHLPQIAKYSEHHIYIEKSIKDNYPVITSKHLEGDRRESELLRMLGGKETIEKVIPKK